MGLIAAIWQKLVWCGLIGGSAAILIGLVGLFHRTAGDVQHSIAMDLIADALVGTLLGMVLLGVPASLWATGKWLVHGRNGTAVAPAPSEAGRGAMTGAMKGSVAAIPGIVIGTIGGLILAVMALGAVMLISFALALPWFDDLVKHGLTAWYVCFAAGGGFIGFLAGTFVGSALGAIFGGFRGLSHH